MIDYFFAHINAVLPSLSWALISLPAESKSFKILKEAYNGSFEELLQDVMKRADLLGNMIDYAFFEMTDKSDKYNKLLRAMGLSAEIQRIG